MWLSKEEAAALLKRLCLQHGVPTPHLKLFKLRLKIKPRLKGPAEVTLYGGFYMRSDRTIYLQSSGKVDLASLIHEFYHHLAWCQGGKHSPNEEEKVQKQAKAWILKRGLKHKEPNFGTIKII